MSRALHLLCAGAVQGLVRAVQPQFLARFDASIEGRFGAVGAMKEALTGGAPCDVLVVTDAMLRALCADGVIAFAPPAPVGLVRTGIATIAGAAPVRIDSADALKSTLLAAPALYLPDVVRSTAGAHVAAMLDRLGIGEAMAPKLQVHANGATAMAALAASGTAGALGCTQATEILYTPGLALIGALPEPFGLATVYSAGASKTSRDAALATAFIDLLCGAETAVLRREGGFE